MKTRGKQSTSADRMKGLGLLFAGSEQNFLVMFLVIALIGVALWGQRHSTQVDQPIDIDRRSAQAATFQVDLNRATWMEISNLPGIGDQLAHEIVAYRRRVGGFADNESIQLVSGIGPRTYQRIAPFLTTISSEAKSMAAALPAASKR